LILGNKTQILDTFHPSITVGNRRRVLAKDVLAYKQKRDVERRKILEEFSNGLYEDGLYDID
jgi:hypothetical protein